MRYDVKRAVVGIVISIIAFALVVPVMFWLLSTGLDHTFRFQRVPSEPIALILTAAALVVGLFWVLWSYSYLLYVGHGSPVEVMGRALDPTRRLVTIGPYAFTRNPMVLGYLWILLGIAFFARSLSGVLLVPIITILAVLYLRYFEEPGLVRRFGMQYEHYRDSVPILFPAWRVYVKPESIAGA